MKMYAGMPAIMAYQARAWIAVGDLDVGVVVETLGGVHRWRP